VKNGLNTATVEALYDHSTTLKPELFLLQLYVHTCIYKHITIFELVHPS